ncbi:hypothetical protein [Flaviaesturariibacter amylovorans]|uniref:DUF2147 domain-containing protein n=1 Tax=Flaviaesturariibacter amylovorans TaxID=1084520 RepID=A0ABP8HGN0_9BACT
MRSLFLFLFVLLGSILRAQDLTGTWEGTEEGNYMRLVIVKVGDEYIGYTYDTDPAGGWCHVNFRGTYDPDTRTLKGSGDGMIARRGSHVECTFELRFSKGSSADELKGTEHTKGAPKPLFDFLDFDAGPVELRRITRRFDTTAYMRTFLPQPPAPVVRTPQPTAKPAAKPAPPPRAAAARLAPPKRNTTAAARPRTEPPKRALPPKPATQLPARTEPVTATPAAPPPKAAAPTAPPALLALRNDRRSTVLREVAVRTRTVTLHVFDNGQPDGDTVSILHNNRVLVRQRLVTVQPQTLTLTLDEGPNEIVFLAHNVGRIPPNTASLLLEADGQRYSLTASTDLQQNAVLRIRYEPE